jgi:S-adenosylmethionine hydrolase
MLVHIVADYGHGDLAFAEVVQRFADLFPDARIVCTPVPPFATLAAGFCIAQLGLNPAPKGTIIFHNVAPREDDDSERQSNAGERLAFAKLTTGVLVVGVNAGYVYSFVRDASTELGWAKAPDAGSQFRSRDLFPQAVSDLASGRGKAEAMEPAEVPDIPKGRLAYTDGYGNLKLTLRREDVEGKTGQKVQIAIGKVKLDAVLSDESFGVPPGKLALAPGSSGWPRSSGTRVEWLELFLRGGNAYEAFGKPTLGDDVRILTRRKVRSSG